nr:uncharacterized protein LOC113741206 [Coffea arabica]
MQWLLVGYFPNKLINPSCGLKTGLAELWESFASVSLENVGCCIAMFGELAEFMCVPVGKPPSEVCGGLLDDDAFGDWKGEGLSCGCSKVLKEHLEMASEHHFLHKDSLHYSSGFCCLKFIEF